MNKNISKKNKFLCLCRESKIKRKIKFIFFRLFHLIENNGNADPQTNGEFNLHRFLSYFWSYQNLKKVTIFDVGAHEGDWSLNFLRELKSKNLNFEIHLFEPQKSCFKLLEKKFTQFDNVYINSFGISDKEGTQILYKDEDVSSLASLYKRDKLDFLIEELVQLRRLDNYIVSQRIDKIHFVKIDTEGHDMKVLLSLGEFLSADFIDFIQFEYGGTHIYSRTFLFDFFNLLEGKGFSIAKIQRKGLELRNYEQYMENFTYSNYIAISNKILKSNVFIK